MENSIFISAGEISGDLHASELMKSIGEIAPVRFYGLGGVRMIEAGLSSLGGDTSTINTVGFVESLNFIGRKLRLLRESLALIKEKSIQNIIVVDNQGFSIPLAQAAKKVGARVFYYVPPQVSVWGAWNTPKVAEAVDYILPYLASDEPLYREYSDNVFYAGNPLADKIAHFSPNENFHTENGLDPQKPLIGLFPGSRNQEIKTLLPVLLHSAALILKSEPGMQFALPLSHEIYRKPVEKAVKAAGLEKTIHILAPSLDNSYNLMRNSGVNLSASGTATLESVLLGTPPLILYKISALSFAIGKRLVTKQMVGLPNILSDEIVFPELLQKDCNPQAISAHALTWLTQNYKGSPGFTAAREKISRATGEAGAVKRAAQYIVEHL